MANGFVADIAGDVNRGLQFAQQERLNPLQVQEAQLGLRQQQQQLAAQPQQQAQQFQLGQLELKALEQQIQQRTDEQKNRDFVNSALRLKDLPDDQKLNALIQQRKTIIANKGDTTDTDLGIQLATDGKFTELNEGIDNIINQGVRQGIIKAPSTKPQELALEKTRLNLYR